MQVTKRYLLYVLLIFCCIYLNNFAQQIDTELKKLTMGADVILTGKVTQQASSWNENKTRIYTLAIIQVDEYIKGLKAGSTVTVKYLGGEVGGIGELYSHMPRFQDKEEVLIFLKKDEKSTNYKVFNGEKGKISVINDPKTGEKITTSNVQINSLKAQINSYIND